MTTEKNVATTSPAIDAMRSAAKPVRTLVAGTAAMRRAGETYLPKMPAESLESYRARLANSYLFNATGKTVDDMTGRVFAKPIALQNDVPAELVKFAEDIDLCGRNLNVFARDAFEAALQDGISFIFIDMQRAPVREDGQIPTLADEQRAGLRPYWISITIDRLLGFKAEMIDGVERLTQLRFMECVYETDDEFHEKEVEQVRVIESDNWRTYRRANDDQGEWELHEQGPMSLGKIACVPIYADRAGFMLGKPPLAKLAELNLAHWQSSSDQRNILHVARVPILFGAGFNEESVIEVGASRMVRASDSAAKLSYIEHSGQAISAGREELKDLEMQMQAMGLQMLVSQLGQKTATGEIRDNVRESSPLASMADALSDAIEQAFAFTAEWIGKGKDTGGSVEINKDFGAPAFGDARTLIDAASADMLSKQTLWSEFKRRGILADSFDPDVERDRLDEQAPADGSRRAMTLD